MIDTCFYIVNHCAVRYTSMDGAIVEQTIPVLTMHRDDFITHVVIRGTAQAW